MNWCIIWLILSNLQLKIRLLPIPVQYCLPSLTIQVPFGQQSLSWIQKSFLELQLKPQNPEHIKYFNHEPFISKIEFLWKTWPAKFSLAINRHWALYFSLLRDKRNIFIRYLKNYWKNFFKCVFKRLKSVQIMCVLMVDWCLVVFKVNRRLFGFFYFIGLDVSKGFLDFSQLKNTSIHDQRSPFIEVPSNCGHPL